MQGKEEDCVCKIYVKSVQGFFCVHLGKRTLNMWNGVRKDTYTPCPDFFAVPSGVELHEACAVAVDDEHRIWCFNRGNVPLVRFGPDGRYIESKWDGKGEFVKPHSIRFDDKGYVWLVDVGAHCIHKCRPCGERVFVLLPGRRVVHTPPNGPVLPSPAQSGEPFNMPTNVAVHPTLNRVYVSDGYSNSRIHIYNKNNGTYLKSFGKSGTGSGEFFLPHDLCLVDEKVLVADRENHRVQLFDMEGNYLSQWSIYRPCGISIGTFRGFSALFVCQLGPTHVPGTRGPCIGNCVTIHSLTDGRRLRRVGKPYGRDTEDAFLQPHSIACDGACFYTANVAEHMEGPTTYSLKRFCEK